MIRIIRGTFGWFDGRRVVPITAADGAKQLDPGLEERLVKEGVAEYVDAPTDAKAHVEVETPSTPTEVEKPDDLGSKTRAELVELAKSHGIHAGKMSKSALVDAIRAAR